MPATAAEVRLRRSGRLLAGPSSTAVAAFAVSVVAAGRAVDHCGARQTSAVAGVLPGTGSMVTALPRRPVLLHVGTGWDDVHVAVDDRTRVAHAEVLPDGKGPTCAEASAHASER